MALGLMLLMEGIVPFLFPRQWRQMFERITQWSDGQIRFLGLAVLSAGVALLAILKLFF
jgi:uncharacterized protein YjeT (DUF2065 family)